MLDNKEINEILEKLENLEDEVLAVELLKEFNSASKHLGKLVLNLDKTIPHEQWKTDCDQARAELNRVIKRINDI
jgi:patatin-like phospholipase/acyl hydrolase